MLVSFFIAGFGDSGRSARFSGFSGEAEQQTPECCHSSYDLFSIFPTLFLNRAVPTYTRDKVCAVCIQSA